MQRYRSISNVVIGNTPVGAVPEGVGVNSSTNVMVVADGGANQVSVVDLDTATIFDTVLGGYSIRDVAINEGNVSNAVARIQ